MIADSNSALELRDISNEYSVSSCGKVFSKIKNRFLTLRTNKTGYHRIGLGPRKARKMFFVHRLVAQAFIPNPHNLPHVNHKDHNRKNNHVSNLEWTTPKDNSGHMKAHNRQQVGEQKSLAKLTEDAVRWIRVNHRKGVKGYGIHTIAKRFGVSSTMIHYVLAGVTWKHVK